MSGKDDRTEQYKIDYENLAIPEVHTGHVRQDLKKDSRQEKGRERILYDSVAVPEIHIRKK